MTNPTSAAIRAAEKIVERSAAIKMTYEYDEFGNFNPSLNKKQAIAETIAAIIDAEYAEVVRAAYELKLERRAYKAGLPHNLMGDFLWNNLESALAKLEGE